ncbi:MAG: MFS transporter [Bacteroidota bacterium]|nr:MFS transporter [Bacteroidota bacterium]MDP4229220.1 MFS transporter [Bacteroidota bacterium]MDP4236061.1 MFS transporter [Bacteroidota bacterium]
MFKNKALIPIFIVVFVDLLGFSIILPLLPFYALKFDVSAEMIGMIAAVYSVCQFAASPILGALSDRYGRRPILIYSQFGSMAGFLLLALAGNIWIIVLSRFVDGISGGNITIASAYVADVSEPKDRASAMALIGVAFGLGFLFGPLIGGELSGLWGMAAPAYAAAFLAFSSMTLSIFYLKEPQVHRSIEGRKRGLAYYTDAFNYFKIKNLRTMLTIFFFFALPFSLYVSMFSLYAHLELSFNEREVGRFLAYVGLLGIIWQGGVIRPLVKKIGELSLLRYGLAAMATGLLGLVLADNWQQLALVALVFSFGTGVTRVVLSSLVSQMAPPDKKGGVIGVSSSIESLTRIIGPILGGWVIGTIHPNYIGYIGGALAAVGFWLAFTVHRDSKKLESEMIID